MSITKILIVEDEATIRDMYRLYLETKGFSISTAVNGEEGLELAINLQPDLILLDLRMPIMDGVAMLQKLRSHKNHQFTKVIVLTNISKSEAPIELRTLRPSGYLVKAHSTPSQILDFILRLQSKTQH